MIKSWPRLHARIVELAAEHRGTPNDQQVLHLTAGEVRALAQEGRTSQEIPEWLVRVTYKVGNDLQVTYFTDHDEPDSYLERAVRQLHPGREVSLVSSEHRIKPVPDGGKGSCA